MIPLDSAMAAAPAEQTHSGSTIKLENITLAYGQGTSQVVAIEDFSCEIKQGEFVTVVGPSGCGKSSLLRVLMGLQRPTQGRVTHGGTEITRPSREFGMVFQAPALLPWRNIRENVTMPARVARENMAQARERADELLAMVGLEGFGDRHPWELSGGMQQRAGIARSLLHDPDVLLMDEPFAALDALTREKMMFELQSIWMKQQKTVVFVTHGISEAVFLSSKIIVMTGRPGRVLEIIDNPLPRPRQLSHMGSDVFAKISVELRRLLGASEMGDN